MKNLFILFLPLLSFGQSQKNRFTIEGSLSPSQNQKIYLAYDSLSGSEMINHIDSTFLIGGTFRFNGKISEPLRATIYGYLFGPLGPKSSIVFFLSPGKTIITAKLGFELASVKGTTEAEEFDELRQKRKKFDPQKLNLVDSLITYNANGNKEGIARIELQYKDLQTTIEDSVWL
jgi:hypothetical protein